MTTTRAASERAPAMGRAMATTLATALVVALAATGCGSSSDDLVQVTRSSTPTAAATQPAAPESMTPAPETAVPPPTPSVAAAPVAPSPAAAPVPVGQGAQARCDEVLAIVAQWSAADRDYFQAVGGYFGAGGVVTAGQSFEVVYLPPESESGDIRHDRYNVGLGFTDIRGGEPDLNLFPLDLEALAPTDPVVCTTSS